jgi:guanine nucleotide-binding protein subunit alpha
MRLIHKVPFTPQEHEFYRQLVFNNITHGLRTVLEALEDLDLKVAEENQVRRFAPRVFHCHSAH